MKGLKILLILFSLAFVAVIHVNVANAAILWDDVIFSYAVNENSADVYTFPNINPEELAGPTRQSTNTGGGSDPVNSRVDSSLDPPDSSDLGLQFNAGAGGQIISNGVHIEGYAATSTATGGVLNSYAVGTPGIQEVRAFFNRRFHVDSNQAAILSGMAEGVINDPEFSSSQFLRADYDWEGGIWLDEVVTVQGTPLASNREFLDFDDLLNNGPQELQVNLRTQDANGDPVSYILRTALDLDSFLISYDLRDDSRAGDIPVGALGSLGDFANPLWIEANMAEVPIPGSGILLLSGIAAVVGWRKRRRSYL